MLYTVALNTSVVLSCEMAAHPGDLMTFSWTGNTSLISRHLDTMATSRTQSDTSAIWEPRPISPETFLGRVESNYTYGLKG